MRVRENLVVFLYEDTWYLTEHTYWSNKKFSIDAAISKEVTTLVVVAQDENGQILKAWAVKVQWD